MSQWMHNLQTQPRSGILDSSRVTARLILIFVFLIISTLAVQTPKPVPIDNLSVRIQSRAGTGYIYGVLQFADNKTRTEYRLCQSRKYFNEAGAKLACQDAGYVGGGLRLNSSDTETFLATLPTKDVASLPLFTCTDQEKKLAQCTSSPDLSVDPACPDNEVVVLKCFDEGALRLVDGKTPGEGRLQILLNGTWYNTCSDWINGTTADTACRLMGYPHFNTVRVPASVYDRGAARMQQPSVYLPYIKCRGSENSLIECINVEPFSTNDDTCYNSGADAALVCGVDADRARQLNSTTGTGGSSSSNAAGSKRPSWMAAVAVAVGALLCPVLAAVIS